MRIHCFQFAAHEGPGVIADWARDHDVPIGTSRIFEGAAFPERGSFDMLVVMGGPMNIYQDRDFPYLKQARRFIKGYVTSGGKALGICLGSQFLADALGGRVIQNPLRETGWHPVTFTEEARSLLPCLPVTQDFLHWHGDTFELPNGAIGLGASAACENQGFLFEGRVLALQFHPEMTRAIAAALVGEYADELDGRGFVQTGDEILGRPDTDFENTNALLRRMLDAIFLSR